MEEPVVLVGTMPGLHGSAQVEANAWLAGNEVALDMVLVGLVEG